LEKIWFEDVEPGGMMACFEHAFAILGRLTTLEEPGLAMVALRPE
jgi:hypothetical protein